MMDPSVAPFPERVARVRLRPPRIPYVSNVTGTWITAAEATDPGYWVRHLRADRALRRRHRPRCSPSPTRCCWRSAPAARSAGLARPARRGPGRGPVVPSLGHPRKRAPPGEPCSQALRQALARRRRDRLAGFYAGRAAPARAAPHLSVPAPALLDRAAGGRSASEPAAETAALARPEPEVLPGHLRPDIQTAYQAPGDETERRLTEIWQTALGIEKSGSTTTSSSSAATRSSPPG